MTYTVAKKVRGKTYLYEYHSVREEGKVRHKLLRYLGSPARLADNKGKCDVDQIEVTRALDYGPVVALHTLAESIDLAGCIDKITTKGGGASLGRLIEAMVINRCIAPKSRHAFKDWCERTALPELIDLPAKAVSDYILYKAMDYLTDDRILEIQKEIFRVVKKVYSIDLSLIFYDITSTYFEGNKVLFARFGYSRDKRPDKLQINLGLVVTRDGIPVTHDVLPGNTVDVATVQECSRKLKKEFSLDTPVLVTDRGMVSKTNLEEYRTLGYDYVVAVRLYKKDKTLIRSIDDKTYKYADYTYENEKWLTHDIDKGDIRLVIAFNEDKAKNDQAFRETMLAKTEADLSKLQAKCGKTLKKRDEVMMELGRILDEHKVGKYFHWEVNRRGSPRLNFSRKKDRIEADTKLDGKFIIETTMKPLKAEEILRIYIEKDIIEKAMQAIKSIVALRPVYVYKDQHVKAHVFVCVLSLLLLAILRLLLRRAGKRMTAVAALDVLDTLRYVELDLKDGRALVAKTTQIGQLQKSILALLPVHPKPLK
jgi:transposase